MKSLTIVTTWGTKYWPNPVQPCIESTIKHWPDHAKILLYPDDSSQQINSDRCYHFNLCKEQPKLQEFIDRHKNNPKLNPRIGIYLSAGARIWIHPSNHRRSTKYARSPKILQLHHQFRRCGDAETFS